MDAEVQTRPDPSGCLVSRATMGSACPMRLIPVPTSLDHPCFVCRSTMTMVGGVLGGQSAAAVSDRARANARPLIPRPETTIVIL